MKQLMKNCKQCNGVSMWKYVGMEEQEVKRLAVGQCRQEVMELSEALEDLYERKMSKVFPSLKTIAVDSIYAREDDVWDRFEKSWRNAEDSMPIQKCTTLFSDFLASGNLKHLCVRDSSGPLCIEHSTYARAGGPGGYPVSYTRTNHFNNAADQLPTPLGGHVRWVSDAKPTEDMSSLLLAIGRCVGHLCRSRANMIGQHRAIGRHFPHDDKADVDIYCSTSQYGPEMFSTKLLQYGLNPFPYKKGGGQKFTSRALSREEQIDMVAKLQEKVQILFRATGGIEDIFRWHLSADTPVCEACGSGAPM